MAYTDASKGWGLTPGAASNNLSRMAGGGYGSMYGGGAAGGQNGSYEQRMSQIRGNFATRQAQLGEERRRTENDRANELAKQQFQSSKDQWDKEYIMRQGQYDTEKEQWEKQFQTKTDQWDKTYDTDKERWDKEYLTRQEQYDYEKDKWERQFDITESERERRWGFEDEDREKANADRLTRLSLEKDARTIGVGTSDARERDAYERAQEQQRIADKWRTREEEQREREYLLNRYANGEPI
jgi:hypothetical protein